MSNGFKLVLKPEPDGFGFLYGHAEGPNGEMLIVNVMPPASEWRGQLRLRGHEPHETDWVVFVDGNEVARARKSEELGVKMLGNQQGLERD